MPDILKVTTPLINKSQQTVPKQSIEAASSFQIQDASKVLQAHNQSDLLHQNTSTLENGAGPKLLMSLLKDPAVTVSYLKNFFLLEEIFRLVPAANKIVTPETAQLFHGLFLSEDQLVEEMKNQEQESTLFKGELFDFLREVSLSAQDRPDLQRAIAVLLKALHTQESGREIQTALFHNLTFLKEGLPPGQPLAQRIDVLLQTLQADIPRGKFAEVKAQILSVTKELENSLYYSPSLKKVASILTYNLSRYNSNPDFLREAVYFLKKLMSPEQRERLTKLLAQPNALLLHNTAQDGAKSKSSVMETLISLISQQVARQTTSASDAKRTQKILHSLLSSPCNFTPLLHFILPLQRNGVHSFAEIWIDQQPESQAQEAEQRSAHFLLVIDVESTGRFELEFQLRQKYLDFFLYTPPGLESEYQEVLEALPAILSGTEYRLGTCKVDSLAETRSLMDVFKTLPYRRVGIDVKV